MVQPGKAQTTI